MSFHHPFLLSLVLLGASLSAQETDLTSGRPIPPEQACYDVLHYTLELQVDPDEERIDGRVLTRARLVEESDEIVLDLDDRLKVTGVWLAPGSLDLMAPVEFVHKGGEIRIAGGTLPDVGETFLVQVEYGGQPRVAPRAPWDGGFVWTKTPSGAPWIATANQMQGADLWWPMKDQPDDEPDTMSIAVTVPKPLVCASNGQLASITGAEDGWRTFTWTVTTPINPYGVALNIAPYETIEREYQSIAGDTFPVIYWVLPENVEKGEVLMEDILRQIRFMEATYGPYPFRRDKYGIAETPHLGMEHQTIIAYGNEYKGNPWGQDRGFDFLHMHEFAHEWWANLVTAKNWNDFWIHEGNATYAEALYVEHLHGQEAYFEQMLSKRVAIKNEAAVAPREPRSTLEMYWGDREGSPGGDIYTKGAWIMHSLRWAMGDEAFFPALRRMAYPDPELEKTNDGSACRFATTDELVAIAEEVSGQELDWFFEVYLRQPHLPELVQEVKDGKLHLSWETPGDLPFPMPVEVRLGDADLRVEIPPEGAAVPLEGATEFAVDPNVWILKKDA